MVTKAIKLYKTKGDKIPYLTTILEEIPTDTILCKTLTGLGATYGEIKAKRHSIIIQPNVSTIQCKCNDPKHTHDNLIGVIDKVGVDDVKEYILASKDKYCKFLVTPESFHKVKKAFEELDMYMYSECFMLIDESHKLVKDADYREGIYLPLDDFFQFKGKALVSATPLKFSDPRFEENGFSIIKIEPTYDYAKEIDIKPSTNILREVWEEFGWMPFITGQDKDRPFFIFINSVDIIYSIISQLKLFDKSSVFCAPKSIDKLKQNNFNRCYENWDIERMSQYNFFTSRFFNAVDIELDFKPYVILVTDVYFAEQTMFDPYSDVVQIIGRFRNGITAVTHVTNTKYELPQRTEEELDEFVRTSEEVYSTLKTFYDAAASKGARVAYKAAMDSLPFNQMLDIDGNKNWFAVDNYINDALVTGYYRDAKSLQRAYEQHNDILTPSVFALSDRPALTDEDLRFKRGLKTLSTKDRRTQIVKLLEYLGNNDLTEQEREFKADLRRTDSFIVEAYELVGKEVIEELDYSYPEIKKRMIVAQYLLGAKGTETIQLIKTSFKVGMKYRLTYIKEELIRIFELLGVTPPNKITAQSINSYFETKEVWIKKDKALLLVREKV